MNLERKHIKYRYGNLKVEKSKLTIDTVVISYTTEINDAFKKYYMDLYTSQSNGDLSKID